MIDTYPLERQKALENISARRLKNLDYLALFCDFKKKKWVETKSMQLYKSILVKKNLSF